MDARARSRMGWLLLASLTLGAARLPAQETADSSAELLVQLRIDGGPFEVISALGRDTVMLVPVRRVLELAEVRVSELAPGSRLAGILEPGHVRFALDADSSTLVRSDSVWQLAPGSLEWRDGELYVATGALGAALGIDLQFDPAELILLATHTERLPVVRRLARERRRQIVLGLAPATPWEATLPQQRRFAGGAVLDWGYAGALANPVGASLLQLGLGAQALGGSLDLQYSGQQSAGGRATDVRASWSGVWPTNPYLRQLRFGDIVPGTRRPQVLRGFELTNAPYLRPAAFGRQMLDGSLPQGWNAELYQDQQLLGFTSPDTAGRYSLQIPIQYGPNPIEVIAYGPNGEVLHRRRVVQVPFDRLPDRRFEYSLNGGTCQGEPCRQALSLSARYGLTSWLTAEAGSDSYWRDSLPDLWHPYGLVSAAVTPSAGITLEGVRDGFARGRLDLDPTADLHFDVEHTRYAAGVRSPLVTSGTERSRTDAVAFWRPGQEDGASFLQLALSQARLLVGTADAERLALTNRFSSLRLVTGLHRRRLPAAAGGTTQLGMDAGGDIVLRGPGPLLRSLYLRGDLSLETTGLSRVGLGVGRQLAGALRLDVGAGWTRGLPAGGGSLDFALSTNLPGMRGVTRTRYTAGAGLEGSNIYEGSATYDGHLRRVELGNGRLVGRARVVGRVYRDLNGDGRQEPEEPGVAGVRLRVGSRGVTTDSLGRYSAWDLVPFEAMVVEVDTLSLLDPLWVPASQVYRLIPGPNSYDAVDVPLLPASEAAGRVVLREGAAGVSGVGVILRHLSAGATIRITTFEDGSFYAAGLRPGTYEASVARESLAVLGATTTKVRFEVGAGAAPVDGIVLRLDRPAAAK